MKCISLVSRTCVSGFCAFVLTCSSALAANFPLPAPEESLIGQVQYTDVKVGDTATTVAQHYNIGLNAVVAANPGVSENTSFRTKQTVKVPTEFLLPPLPRQGIIVNLPEMRIYYFPANSNEVMTFPIGIGKIGKTIPVVNTKITRKKVNPIWIPPQDIREWNKETQGIVLPKVLPAGPDNPLGPYAIYLGIPSFLIHSTIYPESIGRRASFGCLRMHETDIKQFFPVVEAGIPVTIIDMPDKVAWNDNALYLEAHEPLSERSDAPYATPAGVMKLVADRLPRGQVTLVDWQMVAYLAESPDGIPHQIGVRLR